MIALVSDFDRKFSSAGRALALQARGHRFEPCRPQLFGEIAQLARACGSYPQCRGFKSPSRYVKKKWSFDHFFFAYMNVN